MFEFRFPIEISPLYVFSETLAYARLYVRPLRHENLEFVVFVAAIFFFIIIGHDESNVVGWYL